MGEAAWMPCTKAISLSGAPISMAWMMSARGASKAGVVFMPSSSNTRAESTAVLTAWVTVCGAMNRP